MRPSSGLVTSYAIWWIIGNVELAGGSRRPLGGSHLRRGVGRQVLVSDATLVGRVLPRIGAQQTSHSTSMH